MNPCDKTLEYPEQDDAQDSYRDWHRLLGMFMMNHFRDSPYEVEVEKDVSVKKQLIDVTVIQRTTLAGFNRYPDGLDNMARYNLLSYKSLHESFNLWALMELTGHFVNYRKLVSPSLKKLLPFNQFRLYGITTRYPGTLIKRFQPRCISPGVYELDWEQICIRLIILSRIPEGPYNAIWRLFSARPEVVEEARSHYTANRNSELGILIQMLYEFYLREKLPMTYTRQQFEEEFVLAHLKSVPAEKVLQQYSPEQVLGQYSPKEKLKNLSVMDRLGDLSEEELLKGLPPELLERLAALAQTRKKSG